MTFLDSYLVSQKCLSLFVINTSEPDKMKMASMSMVACHPELLNRHSTSNHPQHAQQCPAIAVSRVRLPRVKRNQYIAPRATDRAS